MTRANTPTGLKINGVDETDQMVTKNMDGTLPASAIVSHPDGNDVRIVVQYGTDRTFATYHRVFGNWVNSGNRSTAEIDRLVPNNLYYVRVYAQGREALLYSLNYNSTSFWTNRMNFSTPVSPPDNAILNPAASNLFDWSVTDPDGDTSISAYALYVRNSATPTTPAGAWRIASQAFTTATQHSFGAGAFAPSAAYDWQVKSRDPQGLYGNLSVVRSFTTEGFTTPPLPISPAYDVGVAVDEDVILTWQFRDPTAGATQGNADIQYRVVGEPTWITLTGSAVTDTQWVLPAGTLNPGYHYEWQVRTTRSSGSDPLSDWSASATFWSILTPGLHAGDLLSSGDGVQGALGCGSYRVFVFDRGGLVPRGELKPTSMLRWGRVRDDISTAEVVIDGFDDDCGALLGQLRSWAHEIVVFRDGLRVWEGPITTLTYTKERVSLVARDPMAYVYRRILRQGYNDSYRLVSGEQMGLKTVVERAGIIVVNALAYSDPNLLPYLSLLSSSQDARQSRIVPDYTKTAWEEIDDMAANAGLDYTTVGRRIILWDTHNFVGVLPEMRDGDFSEPLTVSEYGMNASNYFAVTDGQGGWGAAYPLGKTIDDWTEFYGPLEQLASGYGDLLPIDGSTMTPDQLAAEQAVLTSQAQRNINGRWPAPVVVRVPDNATINPDVNIGINQLIPGTWIPLRADTTVRKVTQMQKLDSITVNVDEQGERVNIVMSPAPLGYDDPDANNDDGEEA